MARDRNAVRRWVAGTSLWALLGLGIASGCASTEYPVEGPGVASDRASGSVPAGSLGVCKRPFTKRPPIVSEKLWQDARMCTPRTPPEFIRIGYGRTNAVEGDAESEARMERALQALRDTPKSEAGNNTFTSMIRKVRDEAMNDPALRDRVAHGSSQATPCDFKYLLSNMFDARKRLTPDDKCTVDVYNAKARAEMCLFEEKRDEATYLSSSWDCVAHSGQAGQEQSCYRLCGYDDYCARQVSCAAPDIDLLMCAMGVCLPHALSSVQ